MFAYEFLQHYWWFIVSLLGGLLVFLLFVQGGNIFIFSAGRSEVERSLIVNSTGRKWELTFTTLVTFGGAFFASFPLFYSTSFNAYWLWVLILISFVFQAVSYEFQTKAGNLLGKNAFRAFLTVNGIMGPFLLGVVVATFFTGAEFTVNKDAMGDSIAPMISTWDNCLHGLEALSNIWNVGFGLAVVFLSMVLGALYLINNVEEENIVLKLRLRLWMAAFCFLMLFLSFLSHLLLTKGYAVAPDGTIFMEKYKYLHNFLEMPVVLIAFIVGVVLVLYGIIRTLSSKKFRKGIWYTGAGTVITVTSLMLVAGYNGTAFYPSTTDLQSSLTIANSCSSQFTLNAMTIVSFIIPFVLAYIFYAWRAMDKKSLTVEEIEGTSDKY